MSRIPSVGDVTQAHLDAVRKMATEVADAQLALEQWEAKLQAAAVEAVESGVPKSAVAVVGGVSRPTLYVWLSQALASEERP